MYCCSPGIVQTPSGCNSAFFVKIFFSCSFALLASVSGKIKKLLGKLTVMEWPPQCFEFTQNQFRSVGLKIGHFTVVCLDTYLPTFLQAYLLFSFKCQLVSLRKTWTQVDLHNNIQ